MVLHGMSCAPSKARKNRMWMLLKALGQRSGAVLDEGQNQEAFTARCARVRLLADPSGYSLPTGSAGQEFHRILLLSAVSIEAALAFCRRYGCIKFVYNGTLIVRGILALCLDYEHRL